ncbi:MAG: SPOR domain-containing protein [Cellvibrionaceae bacterium]
MSQTRRRSATKKTNKRNTRKKHHESTIPGWVWLFTGVILGAFVMFLFYLKDIPPQPKMANNPSNEKTSAWNRSQEENSDRQNTEKTGKLKETASDGAPAPDFVFYELLKENELIVETDPTVSQQAALKALKSIEYIIQAGSFRNIEDAERLRAKLILNNLPAKIDSRTVGESTWHRIMVGPFKNRPMTAKARGTLASMNIDTMVIKRNLEQ